MGRYLLIAMRNLAQNRRRTLLLGGAIAAATLLLVLMAGMSNGVRQSMIRGLTATTSGHVNVEGIFKPTPDDTSTLIVDPAPLLEAIRKEVPDAELVVDRLSAELRIISPALTTRAEVTGIDLKREVRLGEVLKVVRGRIGDLSRPNTILLFEGHARRLAVTVGDSVTLTGETLLGAKNALDVEVVAIVQDLGRITTGTVLTSKQVVKDLLLVSPSSTSRILVYFSSLDVASERADHLRKAFARLGLRVLDPTNDPFWRVVQIAQGEEWKGQRIGVSTWEQALANFNWLLSLFKGITWTIVTLLLLVIVIGVMSTLWIIIRERTREIGALRAIGISRSGVLVMFLAETGILSLGASTLGALTGAGAARLLNLAHIKVGSSLHLFLMADHLVFASTPGTIGVAVAVITLVVTFFSLYPAYRASRLPPAVALRLEG
jgi:putative ABC transport system permease protein